MSTLRYREHISLPDLYTLILSAPPFKAHLQATKRLPTSTSTTSPSPSPISTLSTAGVDVSGVAMNGLSSKNIHSFINGNMELLRSVLMEGSSEYIIQEDRRN